MKSKLFREHPELRPALARALWALLDELNDRPTPVKGVHHVEALTFEVASRSGDHPHKVDLRANDFLGWCDCKNFEMVGQPGYDRTHEVLESLRCWHIRQAHRWLAWAIVPLLAEIFRDEDPSKQKV